MADIINIKFNLPKENVSFNVHQIAELDSITLNIVLGAAPAGGGAAAWGSITGDIENQRDLMERLENTVNEAPDDDKIYGRRNKMWKETALEEDVEWGDF
ncbi:MAG: hypothetical protein MJY71_02400 [Bacteroidaceae bacterium]|nr:hypothetical protein [Bacteroidaceae bacterium]